MHTPLRLPRFLAPFLFTIALMPAGCGGEDPAKSAPTPVPEKTETAILGGGCFWCLEAVYEKVVGVTDVESGYAGGARANPAYEAVCTGTTGHAEVVKITYDPARISYAQLLEIFRDIHDPTTLNAQGADRGTQYRSVILYADAGQEASAQAWLKEAQTHFTDKVTTQLAALSANPYWPAEAYHQDYFRKHPNQPYCAATIPPKLQKLFKKHSDKTAK
jgi:peptide-methionine (S)-S-oxide reductase